jgi:hypothetical protein
MSNANGLVTSFELAIAPDQTLVATVRRFVGELCARVLDDPDITSRVIVATHELLDNAVRHASTPWSVFGDTSALGSTNVLAMTRSSADALAHTTTIRVELERHSDDVGVVIQTRNRIDADRGRMLKRLFEEMQAASDRAAFYRELIGRAARMDGWGLGLGRVYAEAGMDLTRRLEDDIVVIRAQGRYAPASGGSRR